MPKQSPLPTLKTLVRFTPNALSLGNIGLGFSSIILAFAGQFEIAGMLLLLAIILDLWDGKLARLMNAGSPVGQELDNLADVVSSGVAPAAIFFLYLSNDSFISSITLWGTTSTINYVLLVWGVIYVGAAALRLAVFSTRHDTPHFRGIPTTASCGVAITCLTFDALPQGIFNLIAQVDDGFSYPSILIAFYFILIPILMLSPLSYPKASSSFLGRPKGYKSFIINAGLITLLILFFKYVAHAVFLGYAIFGPLYIKKHNKPSNTHK